LKSTAKKSGTRSTRCSRWGGVGMPAVDRRRRGGLMAMREGLRARPPWQSHPLTRRPPNDTVRANVCVSLLCVSLLCVSLPLAVGGNHRGTEAEHAPGAYRAWAWAWAWACAVDRSPPSLPFFLCPMRPSCCCFEQVFCTSDPSPSPLLLSSPTLLPPHPSESGTVSLPSERTP
jgi:hypothetical protein